MGWDGWKTCIFFRDYHGIMANPWTGFYEPAFSFISLYSILEIQF